MLNWRLSQKGIYEFNQLIIFESFVGQQTMRQKKNINNKNNKSNLNKSYLTF